MSVMEERVWAGSDGSYDAALTAEQGLAERTASGQFDAAEDAAKVEAWREWCKFNHCEVEG